MKHLSIILLCLTATLNMGAQEEDEYQMEMGGALGLDFYMGDANKVPFRHTSVMGGLLVRKIFNPRMVLKGNLAMGHLAGNTKGYYIPEDATSKTPEGGVPVSFKFKRNVVDLGAQFEFNFWGYSMGEAYKGNSRFTPYAVAGAGLTLVTGGGGGTTPITPVTPGVPAVPAVPAAAANDGLITIDDFETPLGLGGVYLNVGDCYE